MTSLYELKKKTDIENSTPLKVCFVCTGNTCRSPMAAAVLNALGNGKYIAESAGIMADKGAPINPKALAALKKAGIMPDKRIDYTAHKARQLDLHIMEDCDLIVGVGKGHEMMIMQYFPIYASKVTSFENSITDPYGSSEEVYSRCLDEIIREIKAKFLLFGGE